MARPGAGRKGAAIGLEGSGPARCGDGYACRVCQRGGCAAGEERQDNTSFLAWATQGMEATLSEITGVGAEACGWRRPNKHRLSACHVLGPGDGSLIPGSPESGDETLHYRLDSGQRLRVHDFK